MYMFSLLSCIFLLLCVSGFDLQAGCSALPQVPTVAPHKMAICTMVNNEAIYIQEWVAYHHVVLKVDHFYIYNDGSSDNIEQVLKSYIDKGIVSLFYWDKNKTVSEDLVYPDPSYTRNQRFCIADCIYHHQHESEWMGIWDVDEFLYLTEEYSDFQDFISRYLDAKKLDGFQIPMTVLGPSNHITKPGGLVMENYHWRTNTTMFGYNPDTEKFVGKSMYRSGCGRPEVHMANQLPIHCNQLRDWPNIKTQPNYPVHFKHYFTKSWQDFEEKMAKWGWKADLPSFTTSMQKYYDIYDEQMDKYVPLVKLAIECNK